MHDSPVLVYMEQIFFTIQLFFFTASVFDKTENEYNLCKLILHQNFDQWHYSAVQTINGSLCTYVKQYCIRILIIDIIQLCKLLLLGKINSQYSAVQTIIASV